VIDRAATQGPGKGAAAGIHRHSSAFIGIHRHRHPVGAKDETSWLRRPRITVFITDDNDAA
jgi:hypothetical protein